jgi:hypothetical protein
MLEEFNKLGYDLLFMKRPAGMSCVNVQAVA